MVIFFTKNLVIRNLKEEDIDALIDIHELSNNDYEEVMELKESINKSKNDDFNSEGVKRFAIDKNEKMIGTLDLAFDKPYISFSYEFINKEDTRVNAQELITMLVKYLHNIYKYREINIVANKFDYKKRSLLENLSFKRSSLDLQSNMYTYSIFVINPNK